MRPYANVSGNGRRALPKPIDREAVQKSLNAYTACGDNAEEAARRTGTPVTTLRRHLKLAEQFKLKPGADVVSPDDTAHLKHRIRLLERELAGAQGDKLNEAVIRRHIIGLTQSVEDAELPPWLASPIKMSDSPGVPVLFLSDLHWGEQVFPSQINGVNKYNLEIAHKRMDALAAASVRLLNIISAKMDYPGIVIPLGGDMISGNIHDELTATNELATMPTVLDLFGKLASFILHMADVFGFVFLPAVPGNHGRNTTKSWHKDRHHTSFDWLLYCFLAKHFENDKRIRFYIPDGPDAYFKLYNTRFLLTHGDQFRGGDGMIGALGPIIRGDHKKRSRNTQIDMDYDVMLLGHWHQYVHLTRLIVNGSLKGYDEYAYGNNFGYESPQQALFTVHPKYGITFRMPVLLDREGVAKKAEWVSVAA